MFTDILYHNKTGATKLNIALFYPQKNANKNFSKTLKKHAKRGVHLTGLTPLIYNAIIEKD